MICTVKSWRSAYISFTYLNYFIWSQLVTNENHWSSSDLRCGRCRSVRCSFAWPTTASTGSTQCWLEASCWCRDPCGCCHEQRGWPGISSCGSFFGQFIQWKLQLVRILYKFPAGTMPIPAQAQQLAEAVKPAPELGPAVEGRSEFFQITHTHRWSFYNGMRRAYAYMCPMSDCLHVCIWVHSWNALGNNAEGDATPKSMDVAGKIHKLNTLLNVLGMLNKLQLLKAQKEKLEEQKVMDEIACLDKSAG